MGSETQGRTRGPAICRRTIPMVWGAVVLLVMGGVGGAALTYGTDYPWPDYYHTNYGFPVVWGSHQANSIVGPVDRWTVSLSGLWLDLAFWVGLTVVVFILAALLRKE